MKRKPITSRDNPLYKDLKHLASSSQARHKAGRTLLDGVHLCQAYLQHVGVPPICVVSDSAAALDEVASVLAQCEAGAAQCIVLPDALYHVLSQVENGVAVLFVIDTPHTVVPGPLRRSAVLLDKLQDPGNLGSILRSAAAAGIRQVYCSPGTAFAWSPKVLRAGMGAHFLLEIYEHVDLGEVIAATQIPILATSSHAEQSLYDLTLAPEMAWLFGHEGQGVSEALLDMATQRIAIPHLGKVESLNVAASAAVCFFEQLRQKISRQPGTRGG